jgi:hypothetical protein
MGEGKPMSTPTTPATSAGSAAETQGANTNLSPDLQGGAASGGDRAATGEITEQHAAGSLPDALAAQSDAARQTDNSGLLRPQGDDEGSDVIGQSGEARNKE